MLVCVRRFKFLTLSSRGNIYGGSLGFHLSSTLIKTGIVGRGRPKEILNDGDQWSMKPSDRIRSKINSSNGFNSDIESFSTCTTWWDIISHTAQTPESGPEAPSEPMERAGEALLGGPTLPSPGRNRSCERVEEHADDVGASVWLTTIQPRFTWPVFARCVLLLLLAWKSLLASYRILHRAERSALAQTGLSWIHPSCRRVPVVTVHLLNKLTARSLTNNNHRSFVEGKLLF